MSSVEQSLRLLTIGDHVLDEVITRREGHPRSRLDARTEALVRLGALIAEDAPTASYRAVVEAARLAGAREEDLLAVVHGIADLVGTAKVVSAAPRIAIAVGYDVEAALE